MPDGAVAVRDFRQSKLACRRSLASPTISRLYCPMKWTQDWKQRAATVRPIPGAFLTALHAAIVEVDIKTGAVSIQRYIVIEDCGTMVNPLIVDGQIIGGVAQGIGQALLEHAAYDEAVSQ